MTAAMEASYVPGGWTAIVGARACLLVDLAPDAGLTERCWRSLRAGAEWFEVLEEITETGIRSLPDMALAGLAGDELVIVVRGRGRACVDGVELAAPGVTTWSEHRTGGPGSTLSLSGSGSEPGGATLPLFVGVAAASRVEVAIGTGGEPAPGVPATSASAGQAIQPGPGPVTQRPDPTPAPEEQSTSFEHLVAETPADPPRKLTVVLDPEGDDHPPSGSPVPLHINGVAPGNGEATLTGFDPDSIVERGPTPPVVAIDPDDRSIIADEPDPQPEPQPDPQPDPQPEPHSVSQPGWQGSADEPAPYHDLFGATQHRSVEEAAVRDEEPDDGQRTSMPSPGRLDLERQPAPPAAPVIAAGPVTRQVAVAPPTPVNSSGMIDFVPGASPVPAPSVPAAPVPAAEVLPTAPPALAQPPSAEATMEVAEEPPAPAPHEYTIDRSTQQSMIARAAASPAVIGPVVQAVSCTRGHSNPAHHTTCRACGAPIPEQEPVTIPRPTLGVLRLSTGDVILLDRPVLMGRGPRSDRLVGGEHPNVVRLPSPEPDISRCHLEVRLDGWHVSITDLGSTNGTVVAVDGRTPERLRPHRPATIEPGTVVTLAEILSFRYEVAP